MNTPRTVLAFDFGLRRIGAAVGQDVTGSASPIGVVSNSQNGVDFDAIDALIREWQPTEIVVGQPLHADGSRSAMQDPVDAFIEQLKRYDLPVVSVDERHTSTEAERVLKDARKKGSIGRISKSMVDSAAAVFIAERYLSSG